MGGPVIQQGNTVVGGSSWTPTITFATPGDLSVAYTIQIGWYRKINDLVVLNIRLWTSTFTHTTASGALRVAGLPYSSASATGQEFGAMRYGGITKATYTDFGLINVNAQTYVEGRASGSGVGLVAIDAADTPSGGTLVLNCNLLYLT